MTDDELAKYLCPDSIEDGLKIIAAHPDMRATWERMHEVAGELSLWQAGLGPKPLGVIVCGPKEIRRVSPTGSHGRKTEADFD